MSKYIKSGFTLAETLITLVIIGIIAAITVPTLNKAHKDDETKAKIKKAYSTLSNAMLMVKANGGDTAYNATSASISTTQQWFKTYLAPLITSKVCYDTKGCWHDGYTKQLNGQNWTAQGGTWGMGAGVVMFVLNDGTTVSFDDSSTSQCSSYFGIDIPANSGTTYTITMFFDINGAKKPNTLGKDTFAVVYDNKRGLLPAYYDRSIEQVDRDCSKTGTGISCIRKYLLNN